MTRRNACLDGKGSTDCGLSNFKVAGYSPKNSNQVNEGSTLKTPTYPVRRQSLRLKAINAIYESEDAENSKLQQQAREKSSSCLTNQIKVEHLEPENGHSTDTYGDEERIGESDDFNINDVTLKDLKTRCKIKKRKAQKSVSSLATNIRNDSHPEAHHALLIPKVEEPDLDEPIVNLKLKRLSKSLTKKKRRKHFHSSESFASAMETSTQPSSLSICEESCSSSLATERASTPVELAADDKLELIIPTECADGNSAVILITGCPPASIPELVHSTKRDISETGFDDGQNTESDAAISMLSIIGNCNILDNSSIDWSQKVSGGNSDNGGLYCFSSKSPHTCVNNHLEMSTHNLSPSVSEMGKIIQIGSPELVDDVKNEVLEGKPLRLENVIYNTFSPTVDFIAKFNYPINSCPELHEQVNGAESMPEEVVSFESRPPHHCTHEVSAEFMETDEFSGLPESGEDHFGEIMEMNSSEVPSHNLSPSLLSELRASPFYADNSEMVSAPIALSSDASIESHGILMEELVHCNITSSDSQEIGYASNLVESTMSEDLEILADEVPLVEVPTCSQRSNVAAEHSLLTRDVNNLGDASGCSKEGGCLDNLVLEALGGDAPRNNSEGHIVLCLGSSPEGTYDSPLQSNTSFGTNDSHFSDESSPNVEKFHPWTLEQMVNKHMEKAAEIDAEKLEEPRDSYSSPVCLTSSAAVNGLHCVEDSLSKAAVELPSSAVEENVSSTANMPTISSSEIPNYVHKEHNTGNDRKCDHVGKVEHSPKKLLSNRKDLSPTSQEKLLQALNSSEKVDTLLISNCGVAEAVMLDPERIIKKQMCNKNDLLPPITRGILKSPDSSDSSPCSCAKSSLIRTQAQKAVKFSQRQMHDIESIATKLLQSLKSMKDIVVETQNSEACLSSSSKFTSEEIRVATEKASEAETTTKRWLSMMSKDCNRFCKIMRTAENKVATPTNGSRKRRKKITFADEAGGSLCHVKVFERLPSSLVIPRSEC